MHLAASQRYQQTWPLSELPLVRPISDSSVYKRASAGRGSLPPILKFHSVRRERRGPRRGGGGRENCGASDLFESLVYSSLQAVGDRSFPPTYGPHLCPDSRRFRTWSPGSARSIVRFNGLFFRRPWIYYGKLEESIMGRVRGCLVENI